MFKRYKNLSAFKVFNAVLMLTMAYNTACAQSSSTRYFPFSIGAGFGATIASAGEQTLTASSAANLNLNYNFSPFTSASIETQFGDLSSGNALKDPSFKQFSNQYFGALLHADLQVGEIVEHDESSIINALRNFYFGTGVGVIHNNITLLNVNVNSDATKNFKLTSFNFVVPFRAGYEFKIYNAYRIPAIKIDVGYEYVTAFGQGLDGYVDSRTSVTKFYNYVSAGVKFAFGKARTYSPDSVD